MVSGLNGKRILITGANGFVGSHMVDLLTVECPDSCLVATKRWHLSNLGNLLHLEGMIKFIDCDLTDSHAVDDTIRQIIPDYIFHFAAESFVSPSWRNPSRYMEVNYQGTVNLLESVRKHAPNCVIHIPGSGEEYGDICENDLPITTKTALNPVNPYAVSKVAQDLISKVYFDSYGTKVIRTRSFNHEGPRRNLVFGLPWYAYQISLAEKGLLPNNKIITGHTGDLRNFTHVSDMCRAYLLAVEKCIPGDLYLVGVEQDFNVATFSDCLDDMIDLSSCSSVEREEVYTFKRPTNVPFLIADCSKFVEATEWQPRHTLSDILLDTLNYWRENHMRYLYPRLLNNVYPC